MRSVSNERGGTTIFALVALSALLVIFTIFIDVVRYRIASAEGESAARQTGRSILSAFEPSLLAYGLFAVEVDDVRKERAAKALRDVVRIEEAAGRKGWFSFYPEVTSLGIESLYPLAEHSVFHRQILERMKYIAPLEFGIQVSQKFAKGKARMEEAQQYAKLSREMETLLKNREDALDRAWSTAKMMMSAALSNNPHARLQQRVDSLIDAVEEAEEANEELRKKLNDPMKMSPKGSNQTEPPERLVPHVTVYPSTYFSEYKASAGTIASFHSAWKAAAALASEKVESKAEAAERERHKDERREQLTAFTNEWRARKTAEESKREQEGRAIREQQSNWKKASEKEINKRRDLFKDACSLGATADYALLEGPQGFYEKYRSYNQHMNSGGMTEDIQTDDTETFLFTAFELAAAVSGHAAELRDEVYVNEYVLTHFTYLTYSNQSLAYAVKTNIGDASGHRLQNQEAEYVLYGLPDCFLNLSAAFTELFVFRTALRTMEELVNPQSGTAAAAAVSPMTAVWKALAVGAAKANQDVFDLAGAKDVDLPFVPGVTMNYRDHLRLFYLLHSRNESVLSRMQALIELNSAKDLEKLHTAVRVRLRQPVEGLVLPLPPREVDLVTSY